MAERRPPGFTVPLGFHDCAEVLSISRRIRAAAIGVWTLAGNYSATKLTDGYVPAEVLERIGCTDAIRAALMATEPEPLWEPSANVAGIFFTRWAKYQRTHAEVKAYRDLEAERKRNARKARRKAATSGNAETSGRTSDGQPPAVRAEDGDPKTKTETETKTELVLNSPTAASQTLDARDSIAATPGAELIRQLVPDEHPDAVRTMLRIKATELIHAGHPRDVVAQAVELWLTKPALGPGALPSLVSEVIKTRNSPIVAANPPAINGQHHPPTLNTADLKAVGWQSMKGTKGTS